MKVKSIIPLAALLMLCLAGCPLMDNDPGNNNPNNETPNNENPNNESPNNENPNGENPNGENPNGENPGGETPNGENPNGETPNNEDPNNEPEPEPVPIKTPSLFFAYGRRISSQDTGMGRYSVPRGRALVLAPTRVSAGDNPIGDAAVYEWKVDGVVQSGVTGEYFSFAPTQTKRYTVSVTAQDGAASAQASTYVDCTAPEGFYRRPPTAASQTKASQCFEFTPAPGQFVQISTSDTEESMRLRAQNGVDSKTTTDWAYSLGGWGGYFVLGFDHSVKNTGGNDIIIGGNAFGSSDVNWNEPGVVWVSQDENGNGKPDDTWYELKGSETGKPDVKQRYALTWYRPDPSGETGSRWGDNLGDSGSQPALTYYGEPTGYPYMIPGDYVTFTGTLLPMRTNQTKDPIAGYVDTYGTLYFKISDAIQTDGSPVTLQYIDFVKVQSGVNAMAGVFGEVSTETGIPFAAHME